MRRMLLIPVVLVALVVLAACHPQPVPASDIAPWQQKLEHPTIATSPPPVVRTLLNIAIRQGVPVVCPALTAQADPAYQPFVTATCASIVASDDPFTTTTQVLPALCAGSPPIGATVFPKLAPVLTATCPLIVQLVPLLGLTQYVPLF
jgi:hypothetical protein